MSQNDCIVSVDGLAMHIRIGGAAAGPWLMFGNSLLTDLSLWDGTAAALGAQYRILRYDQRGHGLSGVPEQPCTFERLADDAAALLDALGIEAVTFIGISMGAATGLSLAARHAQRLTALVLCDGAARAPAGARELWDERVVYAQGTGMDAFADLTVRRWFRPESVAAETPGVAHAARMIRATSLDGFARAANALQDYDFTACLPNIAVPAALIVGREDGALPAAMRAMAEAIPAARFLPVADAGHLVNLEQPAAFNTRLRDFLDDTAGK